MSIRIGIIGAGWMAGYHIEGFRKAGAEVVAIADVDSAAATGTAARLQVPRTYASVARMLAREELDAVSIITPNKFHKPLALQALAAKKHVFCEKPPALRAAEVEQMLAAAKKARRLLMFNFNNRARPESCAMQKYLRAGAAGTINSAQALWIRRTGIPGFGGWFTTRALSGGGPVIDLMHMIDLALYFMDYPQPDWVLAQTFDDFIGDRSFKGPWGLPDNARGVTNVEAAAHGFIRFKTGQVLFLRNSWAEMNRREEVSVTFQGSRAGGLVRRLFGRDGMDDTAIDSCELYTHENGRAVNREIVVEADPTMGRVRSAENFALAIEGREEPLNTPDQALRLMKIIDAVYASARTARPVRVR
jgi:predicted dehydrogenase